MISCDATYTNDAGYTYRKMMRYDRDQPVEYYFWLEVTRPDGSTCENTARGRDDWHRMWRFVKSSAAAQAAHLNALYDEGI